MARSRADRKESKEPSADAQNRRTTRHRTQRARSTSTRPQSAALGRYSFSGLCISYAESFFRKLLNFSMSDARRQNPTRTDLLAWKSAMTSSRYARPCDYIVRHKPALLRRAPLVPNPRLCCGINAEIVVSRFHELHILINQLSNVENPLEWRLPLITANMKTKRDFSSKYSPSPAPPSKHRAASPDGSMVEGRTHKKCRATPESMNSSDDKQIMIPRSQPLTLLHRK